MKFFKGINKRENKVKKKMAKIIENIRDKILVLLLFTSV